MEIFIVGVILLLLFNYIGAFDFNKFVTDNKAVFAKLKEEDYDFLVMSKYGEKADPDAMFQLGECYDRGWPVKSNNKNAFHVENDYEEACRWYQKAYEPEYCKSEAETRIEELLNKF